MEEKINLKRGVKVVVCLFDLGFGVFNILVVVIEYCMMVFIRVFLVVKIILNYSVFYIFLLEKFFIKIL